MYRDQWFIREVLLEHLIRVVNDVTSAVGLQFYSLHQHCFIGIKCEFVYDKIMFYSITFQFLWFIEVGAHGIT